MILFTYITINEKMSYIMAGRATFRIPTRLGMRYDENGTFYNGIITDMSESGLFVLDARTDYPENSIINIKVPVKNESLHLSGKLVRKKRSTSNKRGFGIKLVDPPQKYIDYIEELLLTL